MNDAYADAEAEIEIAKNARERRVARGAGSTGIERGRGGDRPAGRAGGDGGPRFGTRMSPTRRCRRTSGTGVPRPALASEVMIAHVRRAARLS